MHNKYIQQIMQNVEQVSYRQQDVKLLCYSKQKARDMQQLKKPIKDWSGNTTVSGHRYGSFVALISAEQNKIPQRSVPRAGLFDTNQ